MMNQTGATMHSFERWTRSEIARLRSQAEASIAEAEALQRTLDRWINSKGTDAAPAEPERQVPEKQAPRHLHRGKKRGYGDKNSFALEKIKQASPVGLTTDELYAMFVAEYGTKYARSSLRSLLWNQRQRGRIEQRGDRHILIEEMPAAA